MTLRRKIRILIVDDSRLFRDSITFELSKDSGLEVVGSAADANEARQKILQLYPEVLILDVEMPGMNGIDFLKILLPQYPIPVVVISTISNHIFEALNAGAVDFVAKPSFGDENSVKNFYNELLIKTKIASRARVGSCEFRPHEANKSKIGKVREDTIIAIGSSTGGTEALHKVLPDLPNDMPGIVIAQHMPSIVTKMYAQRLNEACSLEVKEGQDGDRVISGRVLLAPGGLHMTLAKDHNGYYVQCRKGEKVNGNCPSVDVLFYSVAKIAKEKAIGVILTGMGGDGAKGLLEMRNAGAFTIGQDEKSCVIYGMPRVAFNLGAVMKQEPLDNIANLIMEKVKKA